MAAYKTVRNDVVFLQNRRGHLGVLMVVVFDESFVAEAWLFADEDCGFHYFAEACC